MAKRTVKKGSADDIVVTAAKTTLSVIMHEAYEHVEKFKFEDVEGLTEDSMKRLAVLGRTLVELAKELDNKDEILKNLIVDITMKEVIEKLEDATSEELAGIDEDDVDEEYVPNPNHIDPMFG